MTTSPTKFRNRVIEACEALLKRSSSFGLVELSEQLGFIHYTHITSWKRGDPSVTPLFKRLQLGFDKLIVLMQTLEDWAKAKGMSPVSVPYVRQGRNDIEPLPILLTPDPDIDAIWRRHWVPAGLSAKKAERLEEKLQKPDDLAVFVQAHDRQNCAECQAEVLKGDHFFLEQQQPVCLSCADLDHLEVLPAGDATLTRRARKFSPLTVMVLQFNRRRKKYDRMGLLVTPEAIDQAEESMDEDASERAVARKKAALARAKLDEKLVAEMTALILRDFPNCPPEEAHQIAAHTAVRGSGRVGRSEAGRNLDTHAIELAVIAWIRHQHTNYDELLMKGIARQTARQRIRESVQAQTKTWR